MATPANKALLAQAGLLAEEAERRGAERPRDRDPDRIGGGRPSGRARWPRASSSPGSRRAAAAVGPAPRTLASAHPGAARGRTSPSSRCPAHSPPPRPAGALLRGLHVMLFSDNVSLADEVTLKRLALARRLLVMGPDCGHGVRERRPPRLRERGAARPHRRGRGLGHRAPGGGDGARRSRRRPLAGDRRGRARHERRPSEAS